MAKRNWGASGGGKGAGERRQCGGETGASIGGKEAQRSASTLPPETSMRYWGIPEGVRQGFAEA